MTVLEQRKTDEWHYTGPEARPLSVEPFISKEWFGRFQKGVYRKTWINVGRVEEIPKNGDYFVKRIPTVESGVLVIRGKDGVIRAMHNVCPHRGNELVWDDNGNCKHAMSCRFHGWAFKTDGSLASVTEPEYFPGLDPENVHLTPIKMDIWRGFIFVHLDGEPKEDLLTFLGETGRRLAPYPFEKSPLRNRFTVKVQANWMICMDAFQEGYHAGYIHSAWTNGEFAATTVHSLLEGQHHMGTFTPPSRPEAGLVQQLALKYGRSGLYSTTEGDDPVPGVNPGRHKNVMFDCNVLFPNFFVDTTSMSYWVYRFWPWDYNCTTFEIDLYDAAPTDYAGAVSTAYSRTRILAALAEDLATLERTQKALESGALKEMYVGDDEILVRHGHKVITDAVRAAEGAI